MTGKRMMHHAMRVMAAFLSSCSWGRGTLWGGRTDDLQVTLVILALSANHYIDTPPLHERRSIHAAYHRPADEWAAATAGEGGTREAITG